MSTEEIISSVSLRDLKRHASVDLQSTKRKHMRPHVCKDDDDDNYETIEIEPEPFVISIEQLKKENRTLVQNFFPLYMANAGAEFVEKLVSLRGNKAKEKGEGIAKSSGSGSDPDHSTTRLQLQALQLFDDRKRLANQFPSLDIKCFNLLKNFEKINEKRNIIAHETDFDFARAIQADFVSDEDGRKEWTKILEFIHGCPIQQIAEKRYNPFSED